MRFSLSRLVVVSCSALAILAAPIAAGGLPILGQIDAFAAGKGNGGDHGGSSQNGSSGNSQSKAGAKSDSGDTGSKKKASEGSPSTSKSKKVTGDTGSKKNSSENGQSASKSKKAAAATSPNQKTAKAGSAPGVDHAKLAGLNSLKRNINGLMNSSDPRMDGVRTYVQAGVDLKTAQAALTQAIGDTGVAQGLYDTYVGGLLPTAWDADPEAYADTSLGALNLRLQALNDQLALDPANTDISDEIAALDAAIGQISTSSELVALQTAIDDQASLEAKIVAGIDATTDAALTAALLAAANDNRVAQYGDGYVDADMLAWAKAQLGTEELGGTTLQ